MKTRKLSDGTLQIGYKNAQGWVGIMNIYRSKGGWISDCFVGWEKTITEWKNRAKIYLEVGP